jgi:hypothetical protein
VPLRTGARAGSPARPVVVRAAFEPSAVEFGDVVTARVVVTLDTRVVRPSTAHVVYDIAPLTQLGRATRKDSARGSLDVLTYEVHAACLSDACLSATGRRAVNPGAVHVDVAHEGRAGRVSTSARWVPLTVAGRVTRADLAPSTPPFRVSTALPSTTYRISPATLTTLLAAAAALLAACGVGLAVSAVSSARRAAPDEPNELARALRLIRAARARPEPDRRSALGYAARLLTRRSPPLAGAADTLAWSRPAPTADSLSELATELERELPS